MLSKKGGGSRDLVMVRDCFWRRVYLHVPGPLMASATPPFVLVRLIYIKRDISLWKETYVYEKRHISMKRDIYMWKETCIYEKRHMSMKRLLHRWVSFHVHETTLWKQTYIHEKRHVSMKETNINMLKTSTRTIPALVDLGNCATSITHSSTCTSQSPHVLHSLHTYYTVSNVLHSLHMYTQSPHLLHTLDVAWYWEKCFLVFLKRPEFAPRWKHFFGSQNFQKKHTVYREGSFCNTESRCRLLASEEYGKESAKEA